MPRRLECGSGGRMNSASRKEKAIFFLRKPETWATVRKRLPGRLCRLKRAAALRILDTVVACDMGSYGSTAPGQPINVQRLTDVHTQAGSCARASVEYLR